MFLSGILKCIFERDPRVGLGELEPARLARVLDLPSGVVEFGGAFFSASEESPVAFERLAIPTGLNVGPHKSRRLVAELGVGNGVKIPAMKDFRCPFTFLLWKSQQ